MIHREDAEQRALIEWADIAPMPSGLVLDPSARVGDYLFAIPNGGYRNGREAARFKGQGVRAGVSDLFLAFPSPGATIKHGLFIEMKAPKGHGARVSKAQEVFISRVQDAGYEAIVCYGWDSARQAINKHLRYNT